ncbi:translation initiation factor IF-2-like [Choloepus didactylus]|uniref:translation initiation factor IF-2-like n=1 Tax=Choloepus didactylus TaxID=27675 RepID=UPI00189F6598|nr:translation initiation factor IF-2-like [Choloepus didactylus]
MAPHPKAPRSGSLQKPKSSAFIFSLIWSRFLDVRHTPPPNPTPGPQTPGPALPQGALAPNPVAVQLGSLRSHVQACVARGRPEGKQRQVDTERRGLGGQGKSRQACHAGRRTPTPVPPSAKRSDTVSPKDPPHGFGLSDSWHRHKLVGETRESSSWTPARKPAHHPSSTWPGLGARAGACVLGTSLPAFAIPGPRPQPGPASSAASVPGRARPPRPHLLSLRVAGDRGVAPGSLLRPRPAPPGSAAVRCAPRASTRMAPPPPAFLLAAPPAPRPPRARLGPARPAEKALIGKIAQEPGGGGCAGSSCARAALATPPPEMRDELTARRWVGGCWGWGCSPRAPVGSAGPPSGPSRSDVSLPSLGEPSAPWEERPSSKATSSRKAPGIRALCTHLASAPSSGWQDKLASAALGGGAGGQGGTIGMCRCPLCIYYVQGLGRA